MRDAFGNIVLVLPQYFVSTAFVSCRLQAARCTLYASYGVLAKFQTSDRVQVA